MKANPRAFFWVCKWNWKHPGPIVHVAVQNSLALAQQGHPTHLVVGDGPNSATAKDLKDFYGLPQVLEQFHVHRIHRRNILGTRSSLWVYTEAVRLALREHKKGPVTVISRDPGFLPFLAFLRSRGVTTLYETHDFHAELGWRETKTSFQHRKCQWFEKLFLPRISGILTITSPQAALYGRLFPATPVKTLTLGNNPAPLPDGAAIEKRRQLRTLAYVGHLHGYKGVGLLLRAAQRLGPEGVSLRFLGGNPSQIERFDAMARELNVAQWVRFQEFLPPAELHTVLQSEVSLGAVLLRETFYNRNLTCPVKALDYLSHALPVVGSELPTVRDVVGDAAIYLPTTCSPKTLANAVLDLLNDPSAYLAATLAASYRANSVTWLRRAEALAAWSASLGSEDVSG
jgi:glycosyltransferase involved in cell wall biosynthesis